MLADLKGAGLQAATLLAQVCPEASPASINDILNDIIVIAGIVTLVSLLIAWIAWNL